MSNTNLTFTPDEVERALSNRPFIIVEGIINIRDIGGYSSGLYPSRIVKPLSVLRSGEPTRVTDSGKQQLRALGIQKIFDLRSDVEIKTYKLETLGIEGIEIVRTPIFVGGFDPENITEKLRKYRDDCTNTFVEVYAEILEDGGPAFEIIFRHLADHPTAPCLVHCTAGKDRTGVFAALLLSLLGASNADIAKDYSLTAIGLEPAKPMLLERFKNSIPMWQDHLEGLMNLGSSKHEVMMALLNVIQERYGGVESYLMKHANMSKNDLESIRQNFLAST